MEDYVRYSAIRDKLGLKDSDIAAAINVTKSTFSDWKYSRSRPNVEKYVRIAKHIGTSAEYLFLGENPSTSSQFDVMSKDEKFMQYIQILWNLPKNYRKDIYKQIDYVSRDYDESLKKENYSNDYSEHIA